MRRLIPLVTIFAEGLLGFAAIAVPAQAKVPGPNGQIVLRRINAGLGDQFADAKFPDLVVDAQSDPRIGVDVRDLLVQPRVLIRTA